MEATRAKQVAQPRLHRILQAAALGPGPGADIDPAADWELAALRRRLLAGLWSARVAFVLSVPFAFAARAVGTHDAWLQLIVLPVIATFFAGSLFGAAVRDAGHIKDAALAARRGAFVALAAYFLFAAEMAAMSTTPLETGLDYLMGSLLFSGWLGLPAGFLAGVLAYRSREGTLRYRRTAPTA